MFIRRMIIFLLSWSVTRGIDINIEKSVQPSEDQLAAESKSKIFENSSEPTSNFSSVEHWTVNDENSSSFVPTIDEAIKSSRLSESSVQDEETSDESKIENSSSSDENLYENPIYLSDARIMLNVGTPQISERRSFDARNDESEFEILKVNKETPAIANYREFYENLNRNRGQRDEKDVEKSNKRTKDRVRTINKMFFSNYKDKEENNGEKYERTNENYRIVNPQNWDSNNNNNNNNEKNQNVLRNYFQAVKKEKNEEIFEPGKTLNYENFDNTRYHQNSRKLIDDNSKLYYGNNGKPVVVVEPSDFKIDVRYDNRQVSSKVNPSRAIENKGRNKEVEEENQYEEDVNREDRYGSYEDYSEDYEVREKPRRVEKFRKRPSVKDENPRKLLKEHRSEQIRVKNGPRSKFHRTKPWIEENRDGSEENANSEDNFNENSKATSESNKPKTKPNWSQIGPNIEISHSKGVEIEKPKILVPVNIVPLSNFDHGAAIGNSQGFDFSNVPVLSTSAPMFDPAQNQPKNIQSLISNDYRFSTPIPEIILGQNSARAVILPNLQKLENRPQYASSTISPIFTLSQNQNGAPTTMSPSIVPAISQILLPQSTIPNYPIINQNLHHHLTPNSNYNILVNPNGLHGQNFNPIQNQNPNLQIFTTTHNPNYETSESQLRKNVQNQFVTGASLSVSDEKSGKGNRNDYTNNSNNNQKVGAANDKNVIRHHQIVPAIIHPGISMNLSPNYHQDHHHHLLGAQKSGEILENTWKQLQQLRMNDDARRYQVFRINDNIVSTTNTNVNSVNSLNNISPNLGHIGSPKAHLPILGPQNVEIINPNLKPSPIDPITGNPYGTLNAMNSYQTAILTTPIPIYTTPGYFYAQNTQPQHQINYGNSKSVQNYVDELTQIGASVKNDGKNNQDIFNPINFVPNVDLMKSQTILNSKSREPLPNRLNLVPVLPGGNFFKNSPTAQTELIEKPKLSTDLEKYADEMFKESLKTIYSTHKWNNDRKFRGNVTTINDLNDLLRLQKDLQRFKASLSSTDSDILEAHNSDTNIRTVESNKKKPDTKNKLTIAEIEQLFKSDSRLPIYNDSTKNRQNDIGNIKELIDYLTPPKIDSFVSKSPFVDSKPPKKRGNGSRFSQSSRHNSRPAISRPNPEGAASNHVESIKFHDTRNRFEKGRNYPTFTTSSPDEVNFFRSASADRYSKKDHLDINHPRMHNLLGLMMKNKQLPRGSSQSLFRDEHELEPYFESENRRRAHTDSFHENVKKRSDTPIGMAPPKLPNFEIIRPPNLQKSFRTN